MVTDRRTPTTQHFTVPELHEMMARWVDLARVPARFKIVTDTTDFFRVDYDDVVILGERPYLVRNNEREGRFGIDDEQKFWVKRAIDLTDGTTKILKLVFLERFVAKVGSLTFECVRSPKKEARILDMVRGHPHFMQGFSLKDSAGNIVRILDFIQGEKMADCVLHAGKNHEDYFYNHLPSILDEYLELIEAIRFLHVRGEKHGDVRRDHIIKEGATGHYRWIDFDFNYLHKESMFGYDLFGLGNILVYLVGQGDITTQGLRQSASPAFDGLSMEDLNIIFNNRVVNLKKVYPYIPDALNLVMLHFSVGANVYYDNCEQLLTDLREARVALAQS